MTDIVSQKEGERHHREPPTAQEKGYSALKIFDALNSCGYPFLLYIGALSPLEKK